MWFKNEICVNKLARKPQKQKTSMLRTFYEIWIFIFAQIGQSVQKCTQLHYDMKWTISIMRVQTLFSLSLHCYLHRNRTHVNVSWWSWAYYNYHWSIIIQIKMYTSFMAAADVGIYNRKLHITANLFAGHIIVHYYQPFCCIVRWTVLHSFSLYIPCTLDFFFLS